MAIATVTKAPNPTETTENNDDDHSEDQTAVTTKAKKVKAPEPMTAAEWIKHNREHARNRSKHGTA